MTARATQFTRRSDSRRPVVVVAVAVATSSVVIGGLTGAADPTPLTALVLLNIAALAMAFQVGRAKGPIDLFEPVTVFVAAWTMMFVLRPIGMMAYHDTSLRGIYDVGAGLPGALVLAALGSAAFGVAYGLEPTSVMAQAIDRRSKGWDVDPRAGNLIATASIALAAIGAVASSSNSGTAYVSYLPLLAVPGALLLLSARRSRWSVAYLIGVAALALPLLQGLAVGQRSTVLFVGGSLLVFHYLRRDRRPSIATFIIGTTLLLLVVVNGLEVLRVPVQTGQPFDASAFATDDLAPDAAAKRLLTGGSTEMLPALALQVQTEGSVWAITPGYLLESAFTHWVPGGLWPEKPLSSAELLYSRYFPEYYFYNKANTQFSVLGDFYFDLGVVGVIVGMFILGVGARCMQGLLSGAARSQGALLLYSPFIPVFLVLLRGDIPLTAGLALYIYAPLILAVVSTRAGQRPRVKFTGAKAR